MRFARAIALAAAVAIGLSGCQAMFTTSLGSAFERTTIRIPSDISASDAKAILDDPATSPAAYSALLAVLNAQAASSTTSAGLAVDAAIGASGISENLAKNLMDAAVSTATPDIPALVTALQDVMTNTAVAAAFARLDAGGGSLDPAVLAASGMSPTDMVLVALVVASTALPPGQDPSDPGFSGSLAAFTASAPAQLAAALITQAAADIAAAGGDTTMTTALKDALKLP